VARDRDDRDVEPDDERRVDLDDVAVELGAVEQTAGGVQ
jgi:hypothetical protein